VWREKCGRKRRRSEKYRKLARRVLYCGCGTGSGFRW